MRWLKFNDAPGDFIRIGAEFARVSLKQENGTVIARERGKSYNRYFTVVSGERQTYEGFGTGVPLEIQQMLGAWPVIFGDVEIHPTLSEQLDAPFLGKQVSAPAKARVLGKLAGTEEVDLAMRGAAADALKASQAARQAEEEVQRLDTQIAGYAYLEALEQDVRAAEKILSAVDTAEPKVQKLRSLKAQLAGICCGIQLAEQTVQRYQNLPAAEALIEMAAGKQNRKTILESLRNKESAVESEIGHTVKALDQLINVDTCHLLSVKAEALNNKLISLSKAKSTLTGLANLEQLARQTLNTCTGAEVAAGKLQDASFNLARVDSLAKCRDRLNRINHDLVNAKMSIDFLVKRADKAQQEYIEELTATGVCPVCGSQINPECLKEVV